MFDDYEDLDGIDLNTPKPGAQDSVDDDDLLT
jgi:hypothetical protein